MWAILEPWSCGWLDGGCRVLSDALVVWLGSIARPLALVNTVGAVQHVVIQCGAYYLDGDGISDAATLLDRWRRLERIEAPALAPFDPAAASAAGIRADAMMTAAVAQGLAAWSAGPAFALALTSPLAVRAFLPSPGHERAQL